MEDRAPQTGRGMDRSSRSRNNSRPIPSFVKSKRRTFSPSMSHCYDDGTRTVLMTESLTATPGTPSFSMSTAPRHSWLFVWLNCVLCAGMLASPLTLLLQTHEMRCEDPDPVDTSEEVDAAEVAFVVSSSAKRRWRCHRPGMTPTTLAARGLMSRRVSPQASRQTAGQVSLLGRCGPLHC